MWTQSEWLTDLFLTLLSCVRCTLYYFKNRPFIEGAPYNIVNRVRNMVHGINLYNCKTTSSYLSSTLLISHNNRGILMRIAATSGFYFLPRRPLHWMHREATRRTEWNEDPPSPQMRSGHYLLTLPDWAETKITHGQRVQSCTQACKHACDKQLAACAA